MTKMVRFGGVLALTVLALAAAQSQAHAQAAIRSLPGYGGKAYFAAEGNCFHDSQGAVVSDCNARYWFIPLDIALPTTATAPSIFVYRPSTSVNVGCQTYAASADNLTVVTQPSMVYATVTGSSTIYPGTVGVSGKTFHLFEFCYMDAGTMIYDVNWSATSVH